MGGVYYCTNLQEGDTTDYSNYLFRIGVSFVGFRLDGSTLTATKVASDKCSLVSGPGMSVAVASRLVSAQFHHTYAK
jgi:hypothetical protein